MFKGGLLCFSFFLFSCLCVLPKRAQYLLCTLLPSGGYINWKDLSGAFSSPVPAFPHKRYSNSFIFLAAFWWTLMSTSFTPCSSDTMSEPVSSCPQLCFVPHQARHTCRPVLVWSHPVPSPSKEPDARTRHALMLPGCPSPGWMVQYGSCLPVPAMIFQGDSLTPWSNHPVRISAAVLEKLSGHNWRHNKAIIWSPCVCSLRYFLWNSSTT